jgi:hypothetical protein
MRTLATQMRLRRLLRAHAEYERRLDAEGAAGPLAAAGSARLLQLLRDVRAAWEADSQGVELAGLRAHVSRSLAAMEAATAAMSRPGQDRARLHSGLRDTGLPLVFFLRGLEDSPSAVLREVDPSPMARSA